MMPITDLLSCARVFDEFNSLSPAQRHYTISYATGLVAGSNKTVAGIAREVLPARVNASSTSSSPGTTVTNSNLTTNASKNSRNTVKHGETRWSYDGYIILDGTIIKKAGDHVRALTSSRLTRKPHTRSLFVSCKKQDEDDQDHDTRRDRRTDRTRGSLGGVIASSSLEYSLKEPVDNLLSWVRYNDDRGVGVIMEEINHLFVHSTVDANVQN